MSKKNDLEFLDRLFERLESDDFINKTINEFGKEVKESIDNSIKNQGYDDLSQLVTSKIKSKQSMKPSTVDVSSRFKQDYENRLEYIVDSLQVIKYDPKYRGYYKEGHQEALQKCVSILSNDKTGYDKAEDYIDQELITFSHKHKKRDKFFEGYIDGLQLMKEELRHSKAYMMAKVKKNLVK
ncbi:MAG: hypothetical protein PHP11_06120 [Erysipelotrichaceae bacterium]|nr:hypothetical protein [Erysipelotrichaceae bacterium]MDD3924658.1 hypothetical protein [Erysipelotrichaceae bacterium]